MVQGPEGENLYFRYYDPRVLRIYLPTCNQEEMATLFGPVTAYLLEDKDPDLLLRFTPGPERVRLERLRPEEDGEKEPIAEEVAVGPEERIAQVILQVLTGRSAGRRIWLRPGQVITVGRGDLTDFAVRHDPEIAGEHFVLQSDHSACRIRDLASPGGTLVNGAKVTEATVRDGDQIAAGQTTFVVRITTQPAEQRQNPRSPRGAEG